MIDRVTQFGTSTMGVGTQNMQGLTTFQDAEGYHETPQAEAEVDHPSQQGSPKLFLIGFILLLVLLWIAHKQSEFLQREVLGINVYNLLVIGITATVFIAVAKIILARFPVPGLTPLMASV